LHGSWWGSFSAHSTHQQNSLCANLLFSPKTTHLKSVTTHRIVEKHPIEMPGHSKKRGRVSEPEESGFFSSRATTQVPASSRNTPQPLYYSPSTVHQLHVAGLSDQDALPSTWIPRFPHCPYIDLSSTPEIDDGKTTARDSKIRRNEKPTQADGWRRWLIKVLEQEVRAFLAQSDIARAKESFSYLQRLHVGRYKWDLRRNGYWRLQAEILMREGGDGPGVLPPGNVPKVGSFFDEICRLYPFATRYAFHRIESSLNFYPIRFDYELQVACAEHQKALRELEVEAAAAMEDADVGLESRRSRSRQDVARIAEVTLRVTSEIAGGMDRVMLGYPYSHSQPLQLLRAKLAAFRFDLYLAASSDNFKGQEYHSHAALGYERDKAVTMLEKFLEKGNAAEKWMQRFLEEDQDDEPPL
jgi:hypothetical protein